MFNIVLVEPEIPHNTGAIARTCVLTNSRLHLIEPLGFKIEDKYIKRAGMDYWPLVDITVYKSYSEFKEKNKNGRFFCATTKTQNTYADFKYKDGDYFLFGKESAGLCDEIRNENKDYLIRIPMLTKYGRSLNLANSANIILYEALRQTDFINLG